MTREKAKKLRAAIEAAAPSLDDKTASTAPEIFPRFAVGTAYQIGDRICMEGKLYRVIVEHTSQADWLPEDTPALYAEISDPSVLYPAWLQPAGAHNAYKAGDLVSHGGKNWCSDIDANVYEPGVYGWSEVA